MDESRTNGEGVGAYAPRFLLLLGVWVRGCSGWRCRGGRRRGLRGALGLLWDADEVAIFLSECREFLITVTPCPPYLIAQTFQFYLPLGLRNPRPLVPQSHALQSMQRPKF